VQQFPDKDLSLFEFPHVLAAWASKAKLRLMTNWTNKTLLRDRKGWRIKQNWRIRRTEMYTKYRDSARTDEKV